MIKQPESRGFTLVEALVSVSIVAVIGALSGPIYKVLQNSNNASVAAFVVAQSFRQAQLFASAGMNDSAWGVMLSSSAGTVFKGESYALRDQAFDKKFDLPSGTYLGGMQEVVFSKLEGLPNGTGTTTVTSGEKIRSLYLNEQGLVEF